MKLKRNEAIELWNSIVSPAGEYCYHDTILGSVMRSHGIDPRFDSLKKGKFEQSKQIADWLRDLADALEEHDDAQEAD